MKYEQPKKKLIKDLQVSELYKKEEELFNYNGADKVIPASELQTELNLSDESIFRFNTGIKTLDRILEGVECGELIVITGLTGEGKTTTMMTLTKNMAELGAKACWFTLEVTPRQFLKKMSSRMGVLPTFFLPKENTENTLDWIEERIVESNVKYGTKVVFIDHLNAIFSLEQFKGNLSLEIGDMVAKIKDMAIKHNQIIFLVAHCKDTVENKEPTKHSIRDSGMIIRLADTILGIWRIQNNAPRDDTKLREIGEEDNQAKVRIWKNRRAGKLGTFFVEHKDHYLEEIEKVDDLTKLTQELKF